MHEIGIEAVLDRIPAGGPYYLTIDADGIDLVEIAPRYDVGNITMIHAERLICNFIGAAVRASYYD